MPICPSKRRVQFMPEKWQQEIGENCYGCRRRILSDECISLCRCQMYTHEECFLKEFAPYIGPGTVVCVRCEHHVEIEKEYKHVWDCSNLKRPVTLISVILSILMLIAFIVMTALGLYRQVIADGAVYGIIAVGAILLIASIVISLRRKTLSLQDVHVVDTGMIDRGDSAKQIKSIDDSHLASSHKDHNGIL